MVFFSIQQGSPCAPLSPVFKDSDSTEAESHLMSTSFMSADDLYDDQDTPDWESGSDGCESETASSSSGEFIWKVSSVVYKKLCTFRSFFPFFFFLQNRHL